MGRIVKCSICSLEIYRSNSKLKYNKSGLYFCCRKHQYEALKIENKLLRRLDKGNSGSWAYRKMAFRNLPNKCRVCGYDEFLKVLEVHHIDGNRKNNELSNLDILCPTCHKLTTLGIIHRH